MSWGETGSWVAAQAPSNIALIKYMGKEDSTANLPTNASLSMTLNDLCTVAEIQVLPPGEDDRWVDQMPAHHHGAMVAEVPRLGEKGASRILKHVERVRELCPKVLMESGLGPIDSARDLRFELRTSNTFPAASGIASSASSFAAVTLAVATALSTDAQFFSEALAEDVGLRRALARISRQGSGSSCRSFDGPWVRWEGEIADPVEGLTFPALQDLVLIVASEPKKVSSSEAHHRVLSSPLWQGRMDRVGNRLKALEEGLRTASFEGVAKHAWDEMWEMHSLFHTAEAPFTYWEPGSLDVLKWLESEEVATLGKPIATMDAGANVHLLVLADRVESWKEKIRERFPAIRILSDSQGAGARVLAWGQA